VSNGEVECGAAPLADNFGIIFVEQLESLESGFFFFFGESFFSLTFPHLVGAYISPDTPTAKEILDFIKAFKSPTVHHDAFQPASQICAHDLLKKEKNSMRLLIGTRKKTVQKATQTHA